MYIKLYLSFISMFNSIFRILVTKKLKLYIEVALDIHRICIIKDIKNANKSNRE